MGLTGELADSASMPETLSTLPPLLRWAGGKRWLVPVIEELIGSTSISNYHEPFAGGAAVFFGTVVSEHAYLSDLNADLIETYAAVCADPDAVWEYLSAYRNDAPEYYAARKARPQSASARAARFIYLNHTSFNGIYRVNLKGEYNVPFGHRASDNRPSHSHLVAASRRLKSASLAVEDFSAVLSRVGPGDLVFLDPPYTVAHNQNGFIKYNDQLFKFVDQERLSKVIDQIREMGAFYILTNAAHVSIEELFEKGDLRTETSRRNSVGGRAAARGRATEYLFTNLGMP